MGSPRNPLSSIAYGNRRLVQKLQSHARGVKLETGAESSTLASMFPQQQLARSVFNMLYLHDA